jgi:hypothetical protein
MGISGGGLCAPRKCEVGAIGSIVAPHKGQTETHGCASRKRDFRAATPRVCHAPSVRDHDQGKDRRRGWCCWKCGAAWEKAKRRAAILAPSGTSYALQRVRCLSGSAVACADRAQPGSTAPPLAPVACSRAHAERSAGCANELARDAVTAPQVGVNAHPGRRLQASHRASNSRGTAVASPARESS